MGNIVGETYMDVVLNFGCKLTIFYRDSWGFESPIAAYWVENTSECLEIFKMGTYHYEWVIKINILNISTHREIQIWNICEFVWNCGSNCIYLKIQEVLIYRASSTYVPAHASSQTKNKPICNISKRWYTFALHDRSRPKVDINNTTDKVWTLSVCVYQHRDHICSNKDKNTDIWKWRKKGWIRRNDPILSIFLMIFMVTFQILFLNFRLFFASKMWQL